MNDLQKKTISMLRRHLHFSNAGVRSQQAPAMSEQSDSLVKAPFGFYERNGAAFYVVTCNYRARCMRFRFVLFLAIFVVIVIASLTLFRSSDSCLIPNG